MNAARSVFAKCHPSQHSGGFTTRRRSTSHFGCRCSLQNHLGIDREHSFVRRYLVTHAAAYDGGQLGGVLDRDNTASDVWADTAYRSQANDEFLAGRVLRSRRTARANARKSAVRSAVEHVFARQKGAMGLFIRTIGLARASTKIGPASLVYNFAPNGGVMLYTPAKEISIGRWEPAFFSGSNFPGYPDLKITLTAPIAVSHSRSDYNLAIEFNSPLVTGSFTPNAMSPTNGTCVVSARSPGPFVMIVSAPVSIQF
jgi:hypothetical protein